MKRCIQITCGAIGICVCISCSESIDKLQENKKEVHTPKQTTPEWLIGEWKIDTLMVLYKDGRVEVRTPILEWAISDQMVRITESAADMDYVSNRNFKHVSTEDQIALKVESFYTDGEMDEVYKIEKISESEISLTHQSVVGDQVLIARKK